MSLRERTRPGLGIIEPCLPSPAKAPPSGPGWLHEIKHDGFRILARRDGGQAGGESRSDNGTNRSELVCDPDLEKMLHQRHVKRDIQRAARGRRAASAASRGRKGKGARPAWIIEPEKAILSKSHPIGPEFDSSSY